MSQIFIARAIAVIAHKGQKYGTQPYFTHPRDVARRVYDATQGDEVQVAAAWLHDVIEDTGVTWKDLVQAGVFFDVRELVEMLTRKEDETYRAYILRVSQSARATRIKIADLESNLANNPPEQLKARYLRAHQFLKDRNINIDLIP